MAFCTSIHCMDGRIQEPIITYLKERNKLEYVDVITEPGPCKILTEKTDRTLLCSIWRRINISIERHKSKLIAISGHYDCAGNPCGEKEQKEQIRKSIEYLQGEYPNIDVIGLWVDKKRVVKEIR